MTFPQSLALLDRALADGAFPGYALCVGRGDDVWLTRVGGTLAGPGTPPVTPDTRYDMASLSKVLAATQLTWLALERGLITLQDTIGAFFPDAPEDKREITVHQLVTHQSGMEPSFRLDRLGIAPQDTLDAILRHPLLGAPGTAVRYSCMGFITLAKMLEKAYALPLNEAAKRYVFAPLGMAHTGFLPEGGNIAPTERDEATGRLWTGVVHDENARFQGGVSGNAGVFSDIGDMSRFARMLACGGTLEGYRHVTAETLRFATRDHTAALNESRGLGLELNARGGTYMGDLWPAAGFGHTGFTGTSLAVDPGSGLFVALLTNRVCPTRENLKLMRVRRLLHNSVYAEYCQQK